MSQTDIRQQIAQRRIKEFERKFGRHTLHLAYHAALPVALNSELLHLLRINFFLDPPHSLPYMAEIDLLLSPLCQEIGEDLYEIDSPVRDELLIGLVIEYGHKRLREVAVLLWEYIERRASWADDIRLERAQQLTALNFLKPERAKQWLEEAQKYSGSVAETEREWFVATRKEIENVSHFHIKNLPLNVIIRGCQQKQAESCFELFRRAFDEKNEEARAAIDHQYRKLIFSWTYKALASYSLTEQEVEDITSQATIKFFRHMSRISVVERYEHVAQIVGHWKKCVQIATIDFTRKAMRAKGNQDEWIDKVLERRVSFPSPEQEIEQQQLRQEISELAAMHLDEREALYIQLKFRHGLTPRQMVEKHPETFPNSREVYKIWDRVKKRLKPLFELHLK